MTKKDKEFEKEYKIDYDMFDTCEIVKIFAFFKLIEAINKGRHYKKDEVNERYKEYRNILNNISLEKQYDKMLEEVSKVSIYQTIKQINQ